MLSVSNLYCERDERVLFSQLEFAITAGEVLQIRGTNGSGKTTLLRILCGLNHDYEGDVLWDGQPLRQVRESFHAGIFYLGHSPAINRTLSPLQNLRWYCASQGYEDDEAVHAALAARGLAGYEDLPCYQLSAGQQRRVSLARLALSPARLWILDEPFTALDRGAVAELERLIAQYAEQGGAVLLTTHHPLQLPVPPRILDLDLLAGRRT